MQKIDVHCHIYPEEYVEELNKRNLATHPMPVWESAEARIADMDKLDIERQVLSPSSPFVYFEDDELNLDLAQLTNDFLVDICHQHPDRFSGFINVPLGNVKHAIDELKRMVKAPGMLGIALGAHIHGKLLASPGYTPFFDEVDRLGMPILVHPVLPIGIEAVREHQQFYRTVGFLWETTMAVGRLALNGFFERYENINWILSHLGGAIPFVYPSMDWCWRRNPDNEEMPPKPLSEYCRGLYADTARPTTAAIFACAVDLYGEEHIMFGSDLPYTVSIISKNISVLEGLNLTSQSRDKLFYRNAKRLLGLGVGSR